MRLLMEPQGCSQRRHQAGQSAPARHTGNSNTRDAYLKPVTNSSSVLFCSVSEKCASFFTAKLSTDSLVSCCRRPWATSGGCSPCTTLQQVQRCLLWSPCFGPHALVTMLWSPCFGSSCCCQAPQYCCRCTSTHL